MSGDLDPAVRAKADQTGALLDELVGHIREHWTFCDYPDLCPGDAVVLFVKSMDRVTVDAFTAVTLARLATVTAERDGPPPPLDRPGTFLVWSNEHRMWWRPDRRGYTEFIEEAGRYSRAEAEAIVARATLDGALTVRRTDPVAGVEYSQLSERMVLAPEDIPAQARETTPLDHPWHP